MSTFIILNVANIFKEKSEFKSAKSTSEVIREQAERTLAAAVHMIQPKSTCAFNCSKTICKDLYSVKLLRYK